MIAAKMIDAAVLAMAFMFLAYLLERARERGELMQVLVIALLVLVAGLIVGGALWFHFMDLPALRS